MTVQGHYPVPAEYGDRVSFVSQKTDFFPQRVGEGTFVLCWMGVAEVWDVRLDDGTKVNLYPEFGDTMERITDDAAQYDQASE